jgi:hypothetical protein
MVFAKNAHQPGGAGAPAAERIAPMKERTADDQDQATLSSISMKGTPVCGGCHMVVARYAPQVVAPNATFHRDCYEAWYFARYGKRPSLLADTGERHRYRVPGAQHTGQRAA